MKNMVQTGTKNKGTKDRILIKHARHNVRIGCCKSRGYILAKMVIGIGLPKKGKYKDDDKSKYCYIVLLI